MCNHYLMNWYMRHIMTNYMVNKLLNLNCNIQMHNLMYMFLMFPNMKWIMLQRYMKYMWYLMIKYMLHTKLSMMNNFMKSTHSRLKGSFRYTSLVRLCIKSLYCMTNTYYFKNYYIKNNSPQWRTTSIRRDMHLKCSGWILSLWRVNITVLTMC